MLKRAAVETRHYREAMSRLAGAVQIVTTDGDAGRRGVTVTAACSVSDEPPTVLVCLNRKNAANELFALNGVFALNILGGDHADIADAFSGMTGLTQDERFGLGAWESLATGAPVLADAIAVFDCEVVQAKRIATHRVLFGRVMGLRHSDTQRSLVYHKRSYCAL